MTIPMKFSAFGDSDQRRDNSRNELRLLAEVSLQQGPRGDIRIENISSSGLLLNTPVDLTPGEKVTVFLPNMEERVAEVVWSSENFHGCRFTDPLDEAMLKAIQQRNEAFKSSLSGMPLDDGSGSMAKGESFGDRLTRLRKAADMKQLQLAEIAGVSKTTVWKWENDVVRPRNAAIRKLANIFKTSEMTLLFGAEAHEAPSPVADIKSTGDLQAVIAACKQSIARAAGTTEDHISITIAL
jgi:transcriptional regulator with XRE-family HTH domain